MKIKLFGNYDEIAKKLKNMALTVLTCATITAQGCNSTVSAIEYLQPTTTIEVPVTPIDPNIAEFNKRVIPTTFPALMPLAETNQKYSQYGKIILEGMAGGSYNAAMAYPWQEVMNEGSPKIQEVDLSKVLSYEELKAIWNNLNNFEGVKLYSIGKSPEGRDIYMINVEMTKPGETQTEFNKKPLIMLGGTVHANEGAGGEYWTKTINDFVVASQTNPYFKKLLQNVRITCVPVFNPDGREMCINNGYSYYKADVEGIDNNRGNPSANAGVLLNGISIGNIAYSPGPEYYPGPHLGSAAGVKAGMKWFETYVPFATFYIDGHQQGEVIYYQKPFLTEAFQNRSYEFAKALNYYMFDGAYDIIPDDQNYGHNGEGGTFTEYASAIAEGLVFSYQYGRLVLIDNNGGEIPLLMFKDLDNYLEHYKPRNLNFRNITLEIGPGDAYLGYGAQATYLKNKLYYEQNWGELLQFLTEHVIDPATFSFDNNQINNPAPKLMAYKNKDIVLPELIGLDGQPLYSKSIEDTGNSKVLKRVS